MSESLFLDAYVNGSLSQSRDNATLRDDTMHIDETSTGSTDAPAPTAASTKRARIDPTVATSGKPSLSPLQAAEKHIDAHCESLREGIATLLTTRGLEYTTLRHKLFHRERSCIRLETNDDLIPTSARVNFRLSVCKEAEQLPEYTELQNQVKLTIEKTQLELKAHIVASITVECSALQLAVNKHLCFSLFNVTSLFLLAQGADSTRVHATVLSMLDQHSAILLVHNSLETSDFAALYKTTLGVDCSDDAPVYQPVGNFDTIKRALEAVFIQSWDIYKTQAKENELSLSLKKEAKATLLAEKTEAATMQVDTELPVDRMQLQELIRKEATKLSKELIKKEIKAQLTVTIPKNGKRGQSSGASKNKKKSESRSYQTTKNPAKATKTNSRRPSNQPSTEQTNTRTQSRRKQRARQAEGAANGTQPDSGKRQGNRSKQQSSKNGNGSKGKRGGS